MEYLFGNNLVFGTEDLTAVAAPVLPLPSDLTLLQAGGRYGVLGMVWHIEYVKGDTRTGRSPDGKTYATVMPCAYGEIEGTKDADGEPIDIFLNQDNFDPKAPCRIMDLVSRRDASFDEHKLWLGFGNEEDMLTAYDTMYASSPVQSGGVVNINILQLRAWSQSADTARPVFDRDVAIQQTTISKISEMVPVPIPTTKSAPILVVGKKDGRMQAVVYILSEFNTEAWGTTTDTIIDLLQNAQEGDSITFGISSHGGELDLATRIGSAIRITEAHVTTVSLGPVASAGCLLWCEGHTRLITRGSYFMQHDAGCGIKGKMGHIARFMEASSLYLKSIVYARAIAVGLFSESEVSDMVDRSQDLFIGAREAARRTGSEVI